MRVVTWMKERTRANSLSAASVKSAISAYCFDSYSNALSAFVAVGTDLVELKKNYFQLIASVALSIQSFKVQLFND